MGHIYLQELTSERYNYASVSKLACEAEIAERIIFEMTS